MNEQLTQVAFVPSCNQSGYVQAYLSLNQALELIQNPTASNLATIQKARACYAELQQQEKGSSAYKAKKAAYDKLKLNYPCITWNVANFTGNKNSSSSAAELSGYIFFDSDGCTDFNHLASYPEIAYAWLSFSGRGMHWLAKIDGLSKDNFNSTWQALNQRYQALQPDNACKNINRLAVVGYSANIYQPAAVASFPAVVPQPAPRPQPAARRSDGQNSQQPTERAYNLMLERVGGIADGHRTAPAVFYFTTCNAWGVPQNEALAYLESREGTHKTFTKQAPYIYAKYAAQHGFKADFTPKNVDYFSNHSLKKDIQKIVYNLPAGKTLSDLNLSLTKSSYIQSPTGTGKTWFALHSSSETDFLVPTQDQARQAAYEYGIDYVMAGRQPTEKAVQVGTYNAIAKFTDTGRETKKRTLVIDEAHNFATSAHSGFRGKLMNSILDAAGACYARFICLSGTPVESCHPLLKGLEYVKIRKENQAPKPFKVVRYQHKLTAVINRLERGKLNIIALQDKGRSADYASHLAKKGYKTQCFNTDTKEQDGHREILESFNVDPETEVLIVTSLFFEGINIYNKNIASLHVLSRLSEYDIEQLYSRPRLQQPECMYLYINQDADIKQEISFNLAALQQNYLNHAQQQVDCFNSYGPQSGIKTDISTTVHELINRLAGDRRELVRVKDGKAAINYLGIDYLVIQDKITACYANFDFFSSCLATYGFNFAGFETDVEEKTNDLANDLANAGQQRKAEKEAAAGAILDNFAQYGPGWVNEAEQKSTQALEKDLAYKVNYCHGFVTFPDAVALVRKNLSGSAWKQLRGQLLVHRYHQQKKQDKSISTAEKKLISSLYQSFLPGETISPAVALERLESIKKQHIRTRETRYTKSSAVKLLKQFFEVSRVSVRVGAKVEKQYLIIGNNPLAALLPQPAAVVLAS